MIHLLDASARRVSDSKDARFSAEVHIQSIRDTFVVDNKLVVFGDAVKPNVVEIFDLEQQTSLDWFYCFQPRRISDNWIAYKQFYFGSAQGPGAATEVLLVYDLSKTPAENRLTSPPGMTFPRPVGDNSQMGVAVGFPVFPRVNAEQRSYRVVFETERVGRGFDACTITLLPSMKLVFRVVDVLPGKGTIWSPAFLGVVDLSGGLEDAPSQLVPIPTMGEYGTSIERIEAVDPEWTCPQF